ncbi:hypothetical protein E2F43_09355 [Seongchinamella unica]|uniref:Uncharacterized protein n=1 Tax=Seongchinamella unica TaxID=2547392 RepID=A0A4R5LSL0_9GAMM|nr:PepSY domain-containing protein [Seongchinamella unica]TDG13717.1 hypothetical protein E2F43_09355 [Seongchinamella unica]
MDRRLLIKIHMYLAAFFTPAVLLIAISGGLYLVGVKGQVEEQILYSKAGAVIDSESSSLQADVDALLREAGVESPDYEYVKVSGNRLYTRPTSSDHYVIESTAAGLAVIQASPSLQKRMIELHKGHGPTVFKTFQKVFAVGLLFIMISGLWLGIGNARLRRPVLLTATSGAAVFALLLI